METRTVTSARNCLCIEVVSSHAKRTSSWLLSLDTRIVTSVRNSCCGWTRPKTRCNKELFIYGSVLSSGPSQGECEWTWCEIVELREGQLFAWARRCIHHTTRVVTGTCEVVNLCVWSREATWGKAVLMHYSITLIRSGGAGFPPYYTRVLFFGFLCGRQSTGVNRQSTVGGRQFCGMHSVSIFSGYLLASRRSIFRLLGARFKRTRASIYERQWAGYGGQGRQF